MLFAPLVAKEKKPSRSTIVLSESLAPSVPDFGDATPSRLRPEGYDAATDLRRAEVLTKAASRGIPVKPSYVSFALNLNLNPTPPLRLDSRLGKTKVRPMPSFTVKLPTQLDKKLRSAARRRGETLSMMARRALEREVVSGGPDFAAIAAPHRGLFRGPRNLSTREGYGR